MKKLLLYGDYDWNYIRMIRKIMEHCNVEYISEQSRTPRGREVYTVRAYVTPEERLAVLAEIEDLQKRHVTRRLRSFPEEVKRTA